MPKDAEEKNHEFRLEEYKALRSEILDQIKGGDNIKVLITGIWAAYYYFIFTNLSVMDNTPIVLFGPWWVWAVPILIPALGLIRMWTHFKQMQIFSGYITRLEDNYLDTTGEPRLGWEAYYKIHGDTDYVWVSDLAYFLLLMILSIVIFFVYSCQNL